MSKKAIITIVIAVVILVVAGGWFWYGEKQKPVREPVVQNGAEQVDDNQPVLDAGSEINNQQSEIDMSDWQTYRNEEYGFEVRYPEGWEMKEENNKLSFIDPDNYEDFYKWTEMEIGFWDNVDSLEEKILEPFKKYGYKTVQEFVEGEIDVFSYSVKSINHLDIPVLTMGAHIANDYYYIPSLTKSKSYIKINIDSSHKLKNLILSTIKLY